MRDRTLIGLVVVAVILYLGHAADHIARGDVPWPLTIQSLPFLVVTAAVLGFIGMGLFLYWTNKVGPRFWAIVAGISLAFGWLGHFSPFSDQPPQYILNAYASAAAGWLALGALIALMLVLIITAIYAGYLWFRQRGTAA